MPSSTYIVLIVALLSSRAPAARGQEKAMEETWGFVSTRYDTRSSASVYTGYGWRSVFGWGGVVRNPRSGKAELLGGVGAVFKTGASAEHWLAFATTRTSDVSFAQFYWLPTVRVGAVTSRAQVKWSVPYGRAATQMLSVSPLSMTLPLGGMLAGGVAMDLTAAEGARPSIRPGLELRLKLPGATLGADALRDRSGSGARTRLFFSSVFR